MVKIAINKKELKKFKVNAENCGTFEILQLAGFITQPSEELAQETMKELEQYGIFYTVRRSYGD